MYNQVLGWDVISLASVWGVLTDSLVWGGAIGLTLTLYRYLRPVSR